MTSCSLRISYGNSPAPSTNACAASTTPKENERLRYARQSSGTNPIGTFDKAGEKAGRQKRRVVGLGLHGFKGVHVSKGGLWVWASATTHWNMPRMADCGLDGGGRFSPDDAYPTRELVFCREGCAAGRNPSLMASPHPALWAAGVLKTAHTRAHNPSALPTPLRRSPQPRFSAQRRADHRFSMPTNNMTPARQVKPHTLPEMSGYGLGAKSVDEKSGGGAIGVCI